MPSADRRRSVAIHLHGHSNTTEHLCGSKQEDVELQDCPPEVGSKLVNGTEQLG